MIEITAEQLDRVTSILAHIPGGSQKAVKSAIARTVSYVRTQAVKRIQEKYDISAKNLRAEENVRVRYSLGGTQASILYSGRKIPLYRYGGSAPKVPTPNKGAERVAAIVLGSWAQVYPGVTARGHQYKNTSPTSIEDAFVATMKKSGHTGIFERTGATTSNGAAAIKEIMGSSFAQMLGNQEVLDKLEEDAQQKLGERIEHEITRILNGYGG